MHIRTYAIQNLLAETGFVVILEVHNFNHDDVCRVTELYLSTKFHVCALSEIHELNRNKEKNNFESGYFQFNTFPGLIIDPVFHHSYLLTICELARSLVHHKLKVISGISLSTRIMLANQGHLYIHSTTVLCA